MDYQVIILSLISALFGGGLTGLLGWWTQHQKARSEVNRSEFDIVVKAMNELQQENERLQLLYTRLQADYQMLVDENNLLRLTLARNGINVIGGEQSPEKKSYF